MIVKIIWTILPVIGLIFFWIQLWTIPPQDIKYTIKEYRGIFYIERDYGVYGIDYYEMTYSNKIEYSFTYEVREAKKFKSVEEAEKLIKNNFNLIPDFSEELITKKEFNKWHEANEITKKLIEASKKRDFEQEKILVNQLNKLYE